MTEYCIRRTNREHWEHILKAEDALSAAQQFSEEVTLFYDDSVLVIENGGWGNNEKQVIPASDLGVDMPVGYVAPEGRDQTSYRPPSPYLKKLEKIRNNTCYGFLRNVIGVVAGLSIVILGLVSAVMFFTSLRYDLEEGVIVAALYLFIGVPLIIAAKHIFQLFVDIADTLIQQGEEKG